MCGGGKKLMSRKLSAGPCDPSKLMKLCLLKCGEGCSTPRHPLSSHLHYRHHHGRRPSPHRLGHPPNQGYHPRPSGGVPLEVRPGDEDEGDRGAFSAVLGQPVRLGRVRRGIRVSKPLLLSLLNPTHSPRSSSTIQHLDDAGGGQVRGRERRARSAKRVPGPFPRAWEGWLAVDGWRLLHAMIVLSIRKDHQ